MVAKTVAVKKETKTVAQLEKELTEYKDFVRKAVDDFPSGCTSGKKKFLIDIGLDKDTLSGKYVITIPIDIELEAIYDHDDIETTQDVINALKDYIIDEITWFGDNEFGKPSIERVGDL